MDVLRTVLSRIAATFRNRCLDASLDEEIQTHIDMAIEDHIRRGVPEAEARRLALRLVVSPRSANPIDCNADFLSWNEYGEMYASASLSSGRHPDFR